MKSDDNDSSEDEVPERGFLSFRYERKSLRKLNVTDLLNRMQELRQQQVERGLSTSAPSPNLDYGSGNLDYGSGSVDYIGLISAEDIPSTSAMQSTSTPSTSTVASMLVTPSMPSTSRDFTAGSDPSQGKNWSTAASPSSSRYSSPQQPGSPVELLNLNQLPAGCVRGPPSSPKCCLYEQLSIEIPERSFGEGSSHAPWPPLLTPGGLSPSRYDWPPMSSSDVSSATHNEWPPSPNPPQGSSKFPRRPFGLVGIDPPSQGQPGPEDDKKEPEKSSQDEGGQKEEPGASNPNTYKPSRKGKGGPGKIKNRRKCTDQK